MIKRFFAVSLAVVLLHTQYLPCLNAQSPTSLSPNAVQVKERVAKWGVGKTVSVKMLDGNSFEGTIARITDDAFIVSDSARGRDVSAGYSGVKSAKAPSRAFKILARVGAFAVMVAAACAVAECEASR
jgi:hypothetical protein